MAVKGKTCGRPHPTRKGVTCWGRGHNLDDQHWAYVPAAHNQTTKVTWKLYEEPK